MSGFSLGFGSGLDRSVVSVGVQTPLGPTSASIGSNAGPGTLIAAITGLAAGETIDTVTPNDGRLALDSTRRNLVVGLSALSAGAIAATLTSSTGRTLAMAINVAPTGPQAVVLPMPNFGRKNAALWRDISKSYVDSSGKQKSSAIVDTGGFETFVAVEDLLGNGFGVVSGDKNLQPTKGVNGGMLFADAAKAQRLLTFKNSALNGANKITYAIRFLPRGDLYGPSGAARVLATFSEAATTASPAGGGSAQPRFSFRLSGGAANRRPFITMAVADGATKASVSTAANPLQAVDGVKNTGIVTLDMSGSQVLMNMYMNSRTAVYTESWTPAEPAPWAFNTPDSVQSFLGDGTAFAEIFADLLLVGEIADSARLDAIFAAMSEV